MIMQADAQRHPTYKPLTCGNIGTGGVVGRLTRSVRR